ncbi:uncharacterized protein BO87DRAFT_78317 [Aspergillus neoniger CBS 115656]|uniref:Uncharacterized protein n=1 Tax=Aspergillus neoniger (strain CBS 115656) TaxID=1448310 RepID=A0A318ZFZ7_ASPNB|nr:hypothetical protein BO87DRAFT_78317 [Aspergillus neoniger CBS 115656]PYH39178.1 hypothetical protein BO87DRAFT_78317 [Aspergillus neoniger CBS 115656]
MARPGRRVGVVFASSMLSPILQPTAIKRAIPITTAARDIPTSMDLNSTTCKSTAVSASLDLVAYAVSNMRLHGATNNPCGVRRVRMSVTQQMSVSPKDGWIFVLIDAYRADGHH